MRAAMRNIARLLLGLLLVSCVDSNVGVSLSTVRSYEALCGGQRQKQLRKKLKRQQKV